MIFMTTSLLLINDVTLNPKDCFCGLYFRIPLKPATFFDTLIYTNAVERERTQILSLSQKHIILRVKS